MMKTEKLLEPTLLHLRFMGSKGRNWQMPGDARYQPEELRPFLGYDQWVAWLIIVEWFWMLTLAKIGVMPKQDAKFLTYERLSKLLDQITTTAQDEIEKKTHHDILALLELMRRYLPKRLHRWLHYCATSYDIIDTAYALQLKSVFQAVFLPKMREVDTLWRRLIKHNASILQAGRTHLQTALPVTVGFWLAGLHNRFINASRGLSKASLMVPGKFTGAVGTSAAQRALIKSRQGEEVMMKMLGLPVAKISTQIVPPEEKARYYFELLLLSGALANLGEDARILQASQFGEITSASSSSSAMPHKQANPIAAENIAGMHVSVMAEFGKITNTLVSDLQRDLRWSNVLRSFSAMMVYTYQQLLTAERLLKSIKVDSQRCQDNFLEAGRLVVAELLHLALQKEGYPGTHHLVNKVIVPAAARSGRNLEVEMNLYLKARKDPGLRRAWKAVPAKVKNILRRPKVYIGDAARIALEEAKNKL